MKRSRLRLHVTAAAEARLRSGHPWLFSDSVREQNREGEPGELAVVYDKKDRFLAVGLFDPGSPIRLRVLHTGAPETINAEWWECQLKVALSRRDGLFDVGTTGYRLVHGESDRFPGLVLDRYASTLVLKLYTAAWLPRVELLIGIIEKQLRPERIVLRLSRNVQQAVGDSYPHDGSVLIGANLGGPVIFHESGLQFEADVLRGQKTGFFLDQRENRRRVERLSRGRAVLNAFSFSGGFALYAARGGAVQVADLDMSAHALAAANRNFRLNDSVASIAPCKHESIQADAFEWLAGNNHRKFGLIILDPPSLAKREAERAGAIRAYARLARLGISHLSPGGILVACSCSAHVTAEEFFTAVQQSVRRTGTAFHELETVRHPLDHPADFPEAEYLKAIYLKT